ncbi:anaphase-promoting complex subunit Cdc16p [Monosporozyma unispora]|nr:anaphase promoting complex subunit cdc16 [Kazachstania unispora]
MRNPASPGGTPSQHNSTLAISPFMVNRNARFQPQPTAITQQTNNNGTSHDTNPVPNNNNSTNPFHHVMNSPLGQKIPKNMNSQSAITTPRQPQNSILNNSIISQTISNTGIPGYTMPSTLRKFNFQRNPSNNGIQDNIDSAIEDNNPLKTTLTTNSAPVTTLNEIDVSDLSSIERLRLWRHDALMQHMYTTAEYVGDKIYSITNDPNDAFWLAQVYFDNSEYQRAIDLLSNGNIDDPDNINVPTNNLVTVNIMCRYLLALCFVQIQKFEEALDVVGETNPFIDDSVNSNDTLLSQKQQTDGGIKLESSLCFLRGKIYCAMNNFEKAKLAFKEAVRVDIKNFEAFDTLIGRYLLTPQEEWDFVNELDFSILDDNEEMIKNFYMLRLSKLVNTNKIKDAQELLTNEYNLYSNTDIVCSKIDLLYLKGRFDQCLDICEQFLAKDSFNPKILPTYVTCLFELSAKNKLFLLSHKLAENWPKNPITWFSVATYYMTVNKIGQARKFFSKASILDPTFAPAWLGFAHTYALEGEQDQALAAYSTAARFFPGSHLPYLFLGMQYMNSNTLSLAEEYFNLSYDICPTDPLLLNEMGCLYYKKEEFDKSKKYLNRALEEIKDVSPTSKTAISIQTNLGHTYKRLGENERAIKCFRFILEDSEKDSDVYCTLGFLYLKTNQLEKAIDYLHKSLAARPSNKYASDLLQHALELNVSVALNSDHPLNINTNFEKVMTNINKFQPESNALKQTDDKEKIGDHIIAQIERKRSQNPSLQPSYMKKSRNIAFAYKDLLRRDGSNDSNSDEMMDIE